jgi:hypothetical protein
MDEATLLLTLVFFLPLGLLGLLQAAGDGPRSI